MNWKVFNLKYDKREAWAFEQMSYLLFCAVFNNRIGLFRYKNQTGIETEPIEKDGKFYGFQSKYYTTSIADNKEDIIDSIKKAKAKNKQLDELLLYINQELSESTTKSKKKPQYQLDIENAAKVVGITIQWRIPSHLELQLSLPENKHITDIFFSLDPDGGDLLDEISKHNENILQSIQTEIAFENKQIKIDRSSLVEVIASTSQKKENIIISGEGGCGKTAIFKEFYNSKKIPICVFKANELNVDHINDIFNFDHKFTFAQFLNTFKDEPLKIFVIDSAEKLAEISNNEILNALIQKLKENDWNIIFTTRYAYLNDLSFHIKENYQLSFKVIDVSLIGADELKSIAKEFNFSLPDNQKFVERLRNLFYLREYLQQYPNIDKQESYKAFIDLLWKKRIQSTVQKDNLHLEREKCIINIVNQRCETGRFYINGNDLPQAALFQLKQDEILGYDDTHNGYFITHDIYEEWTLNKIVSRSSSNHSNAKQFFDNLGNSLPIRRAFRLWLSDHLSEDSKGIESFIQGAFTNIEIIQFWKDEILVSVLLSDYSETFFKFFENEIVANDFKILKRILFLLRIACTDISAIQNIEVIKPKGKGWEEVIALIYKHRFSVFDNNLKLVLPVLMDWCDFIKRGPTTRYAGLLALSVIQKTETEKNFYIQDATEEGILKVVFNAANELQTELREIFDKVIAYKWTNHNEPYEGLCSKILEKPYIAIELIKTLPLSVIQLCDLFWKKQPKKDDEFEFGFDSDTMESRYGLAGKHELKYFPASANQTPIKWLLQIAFYQTLDFIMNLTNYAVESYNQSDYGKQDVVKITLHINETEVTQYLSGAIWSTYRGGVSPNVPYLLQSIHMALEKILLEFSAISKSEIIESILLKILTKSKSASLTSVVCSVVLANPDKFYNIALILFNTIELFHFDGARSTNEFHAKSLYSVGYGMDKIKDVLYTDERLKTCEDKHRSSNLKILFLNYQLFGVKGFTEKQNTEFIEKLYKIIDQYKSDPLISKSHGILLARMDRRNLIPKVSKQDDDKLLIEFSLKEISDEHKKESEQAQNQYQEMFKYTSLRLWADFFHIEKNQSKTAKQEEYDKNPLLALSETKNLVEELQSGRNRMGIMDYSIPGFSCSKLLIEHKDKLTEEDKVFCKEIILSTLSKLLADDYDYQISDGVEASVHAIPTLINEYPDEVENYISFMVLALLDETPIGAYKRICDYVIESIHKSKMWEHNSKVAQSILFNYIRFKPIYKNIVAQKRKEIGWGRISKSSILEELDNTNPDLTFENISFDINDISLLDIHDLEIVYQLIPSNTKDKIHLDIYAKSLPLLVSILLKERRSYKEDSGDNCNIYLLRLHIFKRFAYFILERETREIDSFLKPFADSFSITEETASFIGELVSAEDYLNNHEQFWHIWDSLFPKIQELCNYPRDYHLKEIIINYLLAWRWWREGIEGWRSLKSENLNLYAKASKEIGHIPAVLYSVSRVLNSIGTNFKDEGINWIYTIVSNNKSLHLDDLESNTLYYLEKFLRKFVFINKQKIKEEIRLKNKIVPILDFMIERGSIHGYLLRESIL